MLVLARLCNNARAKLSIVWQCNCLNTRHIVHSGAYSDSFVPVYRRAEEFLDRIAVVDRYGQYTYNDIFCHSIALSEKISNVLQNSTNQHRISFLCENNVSYVIAQWACWISKNTAVPLCKIYPQSQLEYYVQDSQSSLIVSTNEFAEILKPLSQKLGVPFLEMKHPKDETVFPPPIMKKDSNTLRKEYSKKKYTNAMIVYTSGTTGLPKGVVLTHDNLHSTITALIDAWGWKHTDAILHTLPLHHIHGIVNALMCPLYCGACCVMLTKFDSSEVWKKLLETSDKMPRITVFMAVPTIYAKLIEEYDKQFSKSHCYPRTKEFIKSFCKENLRLMVSGSAALPLPIMERWEEITGHRLLERYGMTEIGMALSNPLHGNRLPGFVGTPLKGVEVCIVKKNELKPSQYDLVVQGDHIRSKVSKGQENEIGELQVRGRAVFKEYWNNDEATKSSFTSDGWFKTGDTAQFVNDAYKILGRTSADIIKSGGFKISALDVERVLLTHPNIKECAVVGIPDMTWGQKVAAIIVTYDGKEIPLLDLSKWCRDKMASYLIPSVVKYVKEIPRNIMGKVNKKDLVTNIFS